MPSPRLRRAQWRHAFSRKEAQPAPALQCDAQRATVPAAGVEDQPRTDPGQPGAAPDPCPAACRHAVCGQADHRQRAAAEPARCRLSAAGRGPGQRPAQPAARVAGPGTGPGHRLRPAGPDGGLRRCPAVGAVRQRHQHPADGARRNAGSGGLRGSGPAGQAGPRTTPDDGPDEPDEPAVRPGAGRHHGGQPGGGPAGLRAVADPAAGAGPGACLHRRIALQRRRLQPEFPMDARRCAAISRSAT